MIINPKILETIRELNLNERDSILFCNLWWLNQFYPKASELLFTVMSDGSNVINLENEEDYRINFLKIDEEGELKLKYPFLVKEKNNQFEEFCKKLASTTEFNSKGHINQPQDYPVYNINQELRDAFDLLKEFDLDKGIRVVLRHYETTKPAKKLSGYIRENFWQDYQNWIE